MSSRHRLQCVVAWVLLAGAACTAKAPEMRARGEHGEHGEHGPPAAEGCRVDDDCAFADPCMATDCGPRSPEASRERTKCEESYMGPRRDCVCADEICVVDPPEPAALAAEPVPMKGPVVIVPDESIGPIRIGMSREQVAGVKLDTHPNYSGMTVPVTVYFDAQDRVRSLELSLPHAPGDVVVGSTTIPASATDEQAASLLGDCGEPQMLIGGTHTACRDGGLALSFGSGDPSELWIRVPAPD